MARPMVYLHGITLSQVSKYEDLISFKILESLTDTDYNEYLCISYIRTLEEWQAIQHLNLGLHVVIASSALAEYEVTQIKDVLLYRQAQDEDFQHCLDLIVESLVIYQREDQFECTQLDFSDLKHLAFNTPQGFGIIRYALDEILEQRFQFPADFKPQDSDKDATVLSMTLPQENTFKLVRQIVQHLCFDAKIGTNHQIFYALRLNNDEILNAQHNDHIYFIYRKAA